MMRKLFRELNINLGKFASCLVKSLWTQKIGISGAVGNAMNELKDVVSFVSKYSYDQGVSDIIRRFIKI